MKFLTSIEVIAIESLSLRGKKELLLQVLIDRGKVKIWFLGVIYLNISNDVLDMDDDEVSVVDVCHEYRKLERKDLQHYLFKLDESYIEKNTFHVIQIHGDTVFDIICKNVEIEHL